MQSDESYAVYHAFIKRVQAQAQSEVERLTASDAAPLRYRVERLPRFCGCLHVPPHWYDSQVGVQQASACAFAFGAGLVHLIVYLVVQHTDTLLWWGLFAMDAAIVLWQLTLYNTLVRQRPRTLPVRIKRYTEIEVDDDCAVRLPAHDEYCQRLDELYAHCVAMYEAQVVQQLVDMRVTKVTVCRDEPLDVILARDD